MRRAHRGATVESGLQRDTGKLAPRSIDESVVNAAFDPVWESSEGKGKRNQVNTSSRLDTGRGDAGKMDVGWRLSPFRNSIAI